MYYTQRIMPNTLMSDYSKNRRMCL